MSSRKPSPKPIARKSPKPTPSTSSSKNLNTTVCTSASCFKPKSRVNLNSTVLSHHAFKNELTLQDNLEADCDFAYNDYLQAIMKDLILKKSIVSHTEKCNDQLERQRETLAKLKDEEEVLNEKIENIDLNIELKKSLDDLRVTVRESELKLSKSVSKQINDFICLLTSASNKLYLKKVQPLKDQEEYETFEKLIDTIRVLLKKMKCIAGEIEGVSKVVEGINKCNEICADILNQSKGIGRLQHDISVLSLEKTSNLLADLKF